MKDFVLVIMVFFSLSILSNTEAKVSNGFSVDLIHRDSPLSPFYNSSLSQKEITRNAALRSISRSNSPHFKSYGNKAETVMIPNGGDYLMKIFIGNPPVESIAVADTGSDLIWVQCIPCTGCYKQSAPIFDPKKSSSFKVLPCHDYSCDFLPIHSCGSEEQCRYYYSYADRSYSAGDLATDVIGFGSNASLETKFGCGHENSGKFETTETGIVGLGGSSLSLVTQLGSKFGHIFSYCLLPPLANATSKLVIANQRTLTGEGVVSTPLIRNKFHPTFYYLSLEGISINKKIVSTLEDAGNMIIDSGTTLTMLQTSFYNAFETALVEAIDDDPMRFPPSPYKLCYRNATLADLLDVRFHFAGDAVIRLPLSNIFYAFGYLTCLSIVPRDGVSLLGNWAQVNIKVEYDLTGRKISFAPTDCAKE